MTAEIPARRSVAKNALHLVLGQAVSTGLSVIVTALLARVLGAHDFGIFYLATAVTTFTYVFVDWGQSQYIAREVAGHNADANPLLGSSIVFRTGAMVIATLVSVLLTRLLGYDARTQAVIALMIVTFLPRSWGQAVGIVFRGLERMDYEALGNALTGILSAALLIPVLLLGGGLRATVLAQGAAGALALIGYAILYRRVCSGRLRVRLAIVKTLLVEGTALVSLGIFIVAHSYLDAIVLSKLAPATSVGWYAAGNRFIGTLLIPASVLGSALYPRFCRLFNQDIGEYGRTLRSSLRPVLWLGAFVVVGTWLFADLAVSIVYGRTGYAPAVVILKAAAPGLMLTFVNMILGGAMLAAHRHKPLAILKLVSLAVAAILDLLLVPFCESHWGNGGLGISLSSSVSELFMLVPLAILTPAVDGSAVSQMVRAGVAATGSVLAATAFEHFAGPWHILAGLLVFALLSVLLGLVGSSDFNLLRDAVRSRQRAQP